ncbi:MAG TPA: DUF2231 domain-containing protein [Opitutaceae bacterium]|nr:DUF2231 domain-containing protein [Opitutaceae bacterium]
MDPTWWAKTHGATTHFPLALVLCSGVLDAAGFALAGRPAARDLHAAGYWTMLLGALGTVPAVLSGLWLTKGGVLGHGALRLHHLFVWPAFASIVALATWRRLVGRTAARPRFAGYLIGVGLAAGLVLAAGYWGGELAIAR